METPSAHRLGASGGELLVPPRSSARMRLKEALSAKPPSLRILPASETSQLSAPPSGEYGVQSLNFFRFDSMQNPNIVDTFYFNIPLSGYSMPVCALARNRGPLRLLEAIAGSNRLL